MFYSNNKSIMLKAGKICLQQQLMILLPFLKISWIVPRRKVDRYSILRFLFARQSVNLAIFHRVLVNVSDRGENSFCGEWPKRANEQARVRAADGFFFLGKLPRKQRTSKFSTNRQSFMQKNITDRSHINSDKCTAFIFWECPIEMSKRNSFVTLGAMSRIYCVKSYEKI